MRLGIMATTFTRPTLEATLDAVAACGVQSVQFDLACAGVPTLPAQIAPALCARVRDAFAVRGLTMEALSGTFNVKGPRGKPPGLVRWVTPCGSSEGPALTRLSSGGSGQTMEATTLHGSP